MKIASAELQMQAKHSQQQSHEVRSSQRSWLVASQAVPTQQAAVEASAQPLVQLSDAGKAMQSGEANAIEQGLDAAENDPTLRMIRSLVAMLTGKEIKTLTPMADTDAPAATVAEPTGQPAPNPAAPANGRTAPAAPAFGFEYTRHEAYSESEQTSFAASGVINTADGRQISFALSLAMSRSYQEESNVSIRFGNAPQTQDPLVINFDGNAAQLTDRRFSFDLDADGDKENINFATGGSGFLALDRNGDGKINDGSELFGATSGDGFADLAALDSDDNGWIDENDAAYGQLRVWSKDAAGNDRLATLKQADVGAIALAHAATPFSIKDANNELQAQVRSSGVFLHESGAAGTLQQVDLTV